MNKQIEDIKHIREMMEKSGKFSSFSGFSGITIGLIAIAGATIAWYKFMNNIGGLLVVATVVLLLAILSVIFFSKRKARKNKQVFFNSLTKQILYQLAVPLASGGLFSLAFLFNGELSVVFASTLIFYGIALVAVSRNMQSEINYLGLTEIVLGLLATVFPCCGLLFWVLGFGVCHILYGLILYFKYDRNR